jgi:geranylgeranyl reductase family protein
MQLFDLLVIGAGPGGSNAAAVALRSGLRVAQLDAARFPRVKPCAGGVTVRAARSLQLALDPSLKRSFRAIEFNVWRKRVNRFVDSEIVMMMVCRPEFDNDLVEQNRQNDNFTFLDGHKVTDIKYDGAFQVDTVQGSFRAAQLVGADGAYSLVNRVFGISQPRAVATVIEINLPMSDVTDPPEFVPCLDYGAVNRGYGWVFPKHDHWSIGLYTVAPKTVGLRQQLRDYIESKGLRPRRDPLEHMEAYKFPLGGFRLRPAPYPVYLVGDAGGFGDALTGEGIYHALESGRLAGEVAVAVHRGRTTHYEYYRRLRTRVLADTAITYFISKGYFRNVDKAVRVLQNPFVWRPLIQGYSVGATFFEILLKGGPYLLKSLLKRSSNQRGTWR